jgi:hypothetical protein
MFFLYFGNTNSAGGVTENLFNIVNFSNTKKEKKDKKMRQKTPKKIKLLFS